MEKSYKLSFTAGGLLYRQSVEIASYLLKQPQPDWKLIRQQVQSGTMLHATRVSTSLRYFLEIRRRFKAAQEFELSWLADEKEGARLVLFAICCRYYAFLSEFIVETLLPKVVVGELTLSLADFYSFYEARAEMHPELRTITESSRRKIQTVVFHILAEAGIMDATTKEVTIPHVPQELAEHYYRVGDYMALQHLLQTSGA